MSKTLFSVKNLKKHFPVFGGFFRSVVGTIKAVDGIDFEVEKGKVLIKL